MRGVAGAYPTMPALRLHSDAGRPATALKKQVATWPFKSGANAKAKCQPLAKVNGSHSCRVPWASLESLLKRILCSSNVWAFIAIVKVMTGN